MESFYFKNVNEVKKHIDKKSGKGIVIFSNYENVKELSKDASDNMILLTSIAEYTYEGYKENVITGFSYDKEIAEIIEIKEPPIRSKNDLETAYNRVKNNKNAVALFLCNGLTAREESIMTTLYFMKDDFKVIGGSSGGEFSKEEKIIYKGREKVESIAIFFNFKSRTQLIKQNIYSPTNKKLLVTEADPINRTIKTFNNKPASIELARVMGVTENNLVEKFIDNPLGKIYEDGVYIVAIKEVMRDKSIKVNAQIMPNTFVEILQSEGIDKCNKEMKEEIKINPKFALSINCICRSWKFKRDKLWGTMDKELLGICKNHTGFISHGEQFYKKHLNQTMVTLLVE